MIAGLVALAVASSQPTMIIQQGVLPGAPTTVKLDAIPTGTLVTMLLRDVMRVPYVIAPDVLADRRLTSVNLIMPQGEIPQRVVTYLRRAGMTVELVGGTVYVGRANSRVDGSIPSGSPVDGLAGFPPSNRVSYQPVSLGGVGRDRDAVDAVQSSARPVGSSYSREPGAAEDRRILIYVPVNRDPEYLSSVVLSVIPTLRIGSHEQGVRAEPPQQTINGPSAPDVLVLAGSRLDLAEARKLIVVLDRPRALVSIKTVIVNVSDVSSRGSALSVLASLGGGKLTAGSFADQVPGAQFVRLSSKVLTAVLSAVHSDSRFKVVASPNLTALSGAAAIINSGSQTPTVGAVVASNNGPPVQSVVYRDSGIILSIKPVVRGKVIELALHQERSTFVKTTTGVNDSPTLERVSADASVLLEDGEALALAGLTEDSEGSGRDGLFGGLLGVRSHDKSHSELMVILQAQLVPGPVTGEGKFIDLEEKGKPDDPVAKHVDPLAPIDPAAT